MKKAFMIMLAAAALCSCQNTTEQKTALVAHRGYWNCEEGGFSENSIAALKAAQDYGFWGSECDVHLTADNVAIINHNDDIKGAVIREHSYAELKDSLLPNNEHRPTLDEYLTQAEKSVKTRLIIELKPQYSDSRDSLLVHTVLAELKEHELYNPERVGFISFSLHSCKLVAALAPEFLNQYLAGELSPAQLNEMGINGLDYDYNVIDAHPEWIEEAHSLGMSTNVWTVNSEDVLQRMTELGVGAITTDEMVLARKVVGKKELKN